MSLSKKILHDKTMLTLISANIILALACIMIVLLRFGADGTGDYIVQFRENLGIGAFKTGGVSSIFSFIGFATLAAIINIWLSIKTYQLRRQLSVTILSLGSLLLLLALIVSNALLGLR